MVDGTDNSIVMGKSAALLACEVTSIKCASSNGQGWHLKYNVLKVLSFFDSPKRSHVVATAEPVTAIVSKLSDQRRKYLCGAFKLMGLAPRIRDKATCLFLKSQLCRGPNCLEL